MALLAVLGIQSMPGCGGAAGAGIDLDDCADPGDVIAVDVHDSGSRIHCCATPFAAAVESGKDDRALQTEGNELSAAAHARQLLGDDSLRFRGSVGDVARRKRLPGERGWPDRQRLSWPRSFAGYVGRRIGPFLDRKQGIAGIPIEQKNVGGLGDLGDGIALHPVPRHGDQIGGRREVPVPDVVVDGLKVPDPLAGCGIQGKQRVCEQVGALPVPAEEVRRGGSGGHVDDAPLPVDGHARPVVGSADAQVCILRPGVVAEFTGARDGVKGPPDGAGPCIVGTNVAGSRRLALRDPHGQYQEVFIYDPGRVGDQIQVADIAPESRLEIDAAVMPEFADRAAAPRVHGKQACPGGQENAAVRAIVPMGHAAGKIAAGGGRTVPKGIESPQLTARCSVEGEMVQLGRRAIEDAADHDRTGLHLRIVVRICPASLVDPGCFQAMGVCRRDLIEGGVLTAAVAEIGWPVDVFRYGIASGDRQCAYQGSSVPGPLARAHSVFKKSRYPHAPATIGIHLTSRIVSPTSDWARYGIEGITEAS